MDPHHGQPNDWSCLVICGRVHTRSSLRLIVSPRFPRLLFGSSPHAQCQFGYGIDVGAGEPSTPRKTNSKIPPSPPFQCWRGGKHFSGPRRQKKKNPEKSDLRSGDTSIGPGGGGGFWNYVLRGDVRFWFHTSRVIHALMLPTFASTLDVCSSGLDRYIPPRVLHVHSSQVRRGVGDQLSPKILPPFPQSSSRSRDVLSSGGAR